MEEALRFVESIIGLSQPFFPSEPVMVNGQAIHLSGGRGIRLFTYATKHNGRSRTVLAGNIRIQHPTRAPISPKGSTKFASADVKVHFADIPWQETQLSIIEAACRTQYVGYSTSNFVLFAPLRVSTTSNNFISVREDILMYASKCKIAPALNFAIQKTPNPLFGGGVGYEVECALYGRKVARLFVPSKGTFEIGGAAFANTSDALAYLTETVAITNVQEDYATIIPQMTPHNSAMVSHQLELLFTQLAKVRGEKLRLPSIIHQHHDLEVDEIPPVPDEIPPCE
jgi:hypothetical protein